MGDLKKLDPEDEESRAKVVGWFDVFITRLEHPGPGSCFGPHECGQRARLYDPSEYTMDFIGNIDTAEIDWQELTSYQEKTFHIKMPALPKKRVRKKDPKKTQLLNPSILPSKLVSRICDIYRDDYCCFDLPFPSACSLDCTK